MTTGSLADSVIRVHKIATVAKTSIIRAISQISKIERTGGIQKFHELIEPLSDTSLLGSRVATLMLRNITFSDCDELKPRTKRSR